MPNITFNTSGIEFLLNNLKPGKAAGPDNTYRYVDFEKQIAPILQIIFTQSLRSGILPNDRLSSNNIPVLKKSKKNLIHLSTHFFDCCLLQGNGAHIFHSIMNHLSTHNIINPNQHGFRPGFSCVTQLMLLADDFLKAMDSHYQVDLVLLDFS